MSMPRGSDTIRGWPDESREAAELVIEKYGEPDESTESQLTWHKAGPWKRIVASRTFHRHDFPAPHVDAVESVIDYRVPPTSLACVRECTRSTIATLWAWLLSKKSVEGSRYSKKRASTGGCGGL